MNDKELYQQKLQAQLDAWQADLDKLRAKAVEATAEKRLELNAGIESLEARIEEGKQKLSQVASASDDAWETIKGGVESAWTTLKSAASDAAAKFRD